MIIREIDERLDSIIKQIGQSQILDEAADHFLKSKLEDKNIADSILEIVEKDGGNQSDTLNCLALWFYENKAYDNILPLLLRALKIDASNENTLYNLSYVLHKFGELELAMQYLKQIRNKDEVVMKLMAEIEMNRPPLISICIATYNRAERLEKCLASIYSQIENDARFEIVVSDNASPDATKLVVEKYLKQYSNIKYYRNAENIGAERNFVNAIQKSSGDYIFMHGDDDYFVDGSLYMIANEIERHSDCGIIHLNVCDDSNTSHTVVGMEQFLLETSIYVTFCSSTIIRRKELLKVNLEEKVGTFLLHLHWLYSVMIDNPKSLIIKSKIYFYETDNAPGGYSYSFAEVMIKNYFSILEEFIGRGLSKGAISNEKARLVNRTIWYYDYGLKRKDEKFIRNFEEIFREFYQEETYFEQAWEAVLEVRKNNGAELA